MLIGISARKRSADSNNQDKCLNSHKYNQPPSSSVVTIAMITVMAFVLASCLVRVAEQGTTESLLVMVAA